MEQRCYGCMNIKTQSPGCEHCGFLEHTQNAKHQLPLGTVVGNQYILGKVLGQGGFGITYIGWDKIMNQRVAVKEYFPSGYAGRDPEQPRNIISYDSANNHAFEANKRRFLREAESLAKLWNIPQIVRVLRHFEENGTAYIAMEYAEGQDLRKYLKQLSRAMSMEEILDVLGPVMEALTQVHGADLVHRDISPDNIMVLPDGSAKLLDFGAARYVENANAEADRNTSTQAILKHGFAPPEQYRSRGALGPWTDIYALCATVYFCLTGRIPPESMSRMMGEADLNLDKIPGLTQQQRDALEQGMALMPKARIKTADELHNQLFGEILAAREQKRREEEAEQRRLEEEKQKEQERLAEEERRKEEARLKEEARQAKEKRRAEELRKKELARQEAEAKRREEQEQKAQARKEAGARKQAEKEQKAASRGKRSKLPLILAAVAALISAVVGLGLLKPAAPSAPTQITPEAEPVLAVTEPMVTETETQPETTAETVPPLLITETLTTDGLDLGQVLNIEVLSAHDSAQIRWTSDNPEIATVSEDGTVTTVGYGNATVTAEIDGQTASCRIHVYPQANVDCTYRTSTNGVIITGCKGKMPANAVLPRFIDGLPVVAIDDNAFRNAAMRTMVLPDSITKIGTSAFYGCGNLSQINLPDELVTLGSLAFYCCARLKTVTIPKGVTVIKDGTFWICEWLETVILPEGIQRIESSAFSACEKLTSINLPEGLHTIDSVAFFGCYSLESIRLPDSLTSLGNEAFGDCKSLRDIHIPDTLKNIGWLCFTENPWLTAREEEFVIVGDGILVHYNGTDSHVRIPDGVKSFPSAFYKSTALESVTIPGSLTEVSPYAFYKCTKLTSVTIENGVNYIGDSAFDGCTNLTEISIPDSVISINPDVLKDCQKLKNINLPESWRNRDLELPNSRCTITYY